MGLMAKLLAPVHGFSISLATVGPSFKACSACHSIQSLCCPHGEQMLRLAAGSKSK